MFGRTYRIRDLKHGTRCRRFITAHDVLDNDIVAQDIRSLLGSKYRSADYRGELVLWEILACISDLEETGTSVEDNGRLRHVCAAVDLIWEL